MASIYDLKPAFERLLYPIVNWLAKHYVIANQVTIAAAFMSFVSGLLILLFHQHHLVFLIIPFVLFIRMALNAIDCILAREYNMQSNLGKVFLELNFR